MKRKIDLLLDDEEMYELFVDEAIRQGVRLESEDEFMALMSHIQSKSPQHDSQMMVRVAVEMVRERESGQSGVRVPEPVIEKKTLSDELEPVSKPVRKEILPEPVSGKAAAMEEKIAKKLGWSLQDPATESRLETLIERIRSAGISDPHTFLSLREACDATGIAERTLRRYIAEGLLSTEKVRGPRGPEHRIYAPRLFLVYLERSAAFERARSSPLEEMSKEIAQLCRAIVDQQAHADKRVDRLLEEMKRQGELIDELRAEQRDSRAQLFTLQENMIKALLPPPKKSLAARLFHWR